MPADDRSGDRHAGGGVQVRLCQAGFDGLSERKDGSIGTGGMRCRGAPRGIEADFGPEHADTFRRDLRADYVLATARARAHSTVVLTRRACRRQDNRTPFSDSDWFRKDNRASRSNARWTSGPQGSRAGRRVINGASGKRCDMDEKPEGSNRGNELINDVRWQYGVPPPGQRQLRLGAALHPPPPAPRHGRLRPCQWQHVLPPVRRRRHSPRRQAILLRIRVTL